MDSIKQKIQITAFKEYIRLNRKINIRNFVVLSGLYYIDTNIFKSVLIFHTLF